MAFRCQTAFFRGKKLKIIQKIRFILQHKSKKMNRQELEKIIENLDTVFRGDAWHGPSMMELLNSMPAEVVAEKKSVSKFTISQLVFHLTVWRKYVLKKLEGDIHFDLISDEDNYGNAAQTNAKNWKNLIADLKNSQEKLVEKLEELDDSILTKTVPGNYYDFYKLLTGLIQHDTYHLGMIWVLWE